MKRWYRKKVRHYKYETLERVEVWTGWELPEDVYTNRNFVTLTKDGLLTINARYAWDGASGPTFDTPSTMRASLVHDALYQLIREGKLGPEWRIPADELLGRIMLDDYKDRAKWWPWLSDRLRGWHRARVKSWVWVLGKCGWAAARPEVPYSGS